MKNQPLRLGAFWIEGTDNYYFGLRDAKNHQLIKGGNILSPDRKLLYADPYPNAQNCNNCGNRITPTGVFLGVAMEDLPSKCSDCGGKVKTGSIDNAPATPTEQKKSGGFLGLFKK